MTLVWLCPGHIVTAPSGPVQGSEGKIASECETGRLGRDAEVYQLSHGPGDGTVDKLFGVRVEKKKQTKKPTFRNI